MTEATELSALRRWLTDLRALGYGVLAFMLLEITQGREASAIEVLATIPEVLEVHKVTGPGGRLSPRRNRRWPGG